MRKLLLAFLVAVLLTFLYTACDTVDLTPAPQVEIVDFEPVGAYVGMGQDTVSIDSIVFQVMNYVDAIIREMDVDYRSVNNGDVVASNYRSGLGILLQGGQEGCEDSQRTKVVGWMFDISDAVTYMVGNNDNTVAEITFRGEDAFGNEREFSCTMYFSLMLMPEPLSESGTRKVMPIKE